MRSKGKPIPCGLLLRCGDAAHDGELSKRNLDRTLTLQFRQRANKLQASLEIAEFVKSPQRHRFHTQMFTRPSR